MQAFLTTCCGSPPGKEALQAIFRALSPCRYRPTIGIGDGVRSSSATPGPPYSGIHFSCGTDSRPATEPGLRATALAGLQSGLMNASMASWNFDEKKSETARILIRHCS